MAYYLVNQSFLRDIRVRHESPWIHLALLQKAWIHETATYATRNENWLTTLGYHRLPSGVISELPKDSRNQAETACIYWPGLVTAIPEALFRVRDFAEENHVEFDGVTVVCSRQTALG